MIFLNKKNPFIYGFVVSVVAFLIALLQPSAAPGTVAVAFDTAGGTPVEMVTLPGGGKLSSIPTTSKQGSTFEHWLKGTEEVTLNTVFNSNTTLRAVFQTIEYTIVFNTNGGTLLEETATIEYGQDFTLPRPVKTGSVFQGWYTEPELTNLLPETIEVLQDYMVYAKWSVVGVDVVSVSYFSEGLGLIESSFVAPNTTITLITPPERDGYEFVNWINGLTFNPINTSTFLVTQDVVFFADWVSVGGLVTITFDSQGGTPVSSIQVPVGSNWQNPDEVPYLAEGYQFLSWITNCNFDGFEVSCTTLDESYVITDDMTVLARYDYMIPLASMRFDSFERDDKVIGYVLSSIEDFSAEEPISTLVLPARFSGLPVVAIGDYVFEGVDYLDKVVIPENIKYIEESAFANSSVQEVFLPSSLVEIGYESFYGSSLETIHFQGESSLNFIHSGAFRESQITSFHVPSSVRYIGGDVFNTTPLETLTFATPTELAYIGGDAFRNTAITEVTLPEGLRSIDNYAFADNPNLISVHVPASVDWIDNNAFENAPIETITFGNNSQLRYIGEDLFGRDRSSIPFVQNIESDFALAGDILVAYKGTIADGQPLVIPNNVRLISDYVFDLNEPLNKASLTLPESLRFIGSYAFEGATIGGSLTLHDGVVVDEYAFANATFSGNINIGEVERLEYRVFSNVTAEDVIFAPHPHADEDTLYGQLFEFANVETITLGEGYQKLPYGFIQNSQVKELHLPDSIQSIQDSAIGSSVLETVSFAGTSLLHDVSRYALSNEVRNSPWYLAMKPYIVLKNNLVSLDVSSLSGGASITIPNGVKIISNDVMYGWINFESIDFNEVEYFKDSPFYSWNNNLVINQPTTIDQISFIGSSFSRNYTNLFTTGNINIFNNFNIDLDFLISANRSIWEDLGNVIEFNNQGFKIAGNVLFKYNPNFDLSPEEVVLPNSIEIIAPYAFQSVTLPDNFQLNEGLKLVDQNSFYEANFFEGQLTLPSTLEYIRNYAFGYSNLVAITIPASVKVINYSAFYNEDLRVVEFEDPTNLRLDRSAFGDLNSRVKDLRPLHRANLQNAMVILDGVLIGYLGYQQDVVVPEGIVSINDGAFRYRDSFIRSITLPSTLKYLNSYAFSGLENLTSVDFSAVVSLNYVGNGIFGFTSLRSVQIDAPIAMIHPYALAGMPSLMSYELNLINPTHLYLSYGVDLMD